MKRSLWLILAIALQPILTAWSGSTCDTCAKSCNLPAAAAAESPCCDDSSTPEEAGCATACSADSTDADDHAASCASRRDIFKDPLCAICNILCRTMCDAGPFYSITPGPRTAAPKPGLTSTLARLPAGSSWPRTATIFSRADAHPARALSPPERRALLCIRVI